MTPEQVDLIRHSFDAIWSPPRSKHHKTGLSRLRHRLGPAVCIKFGEYRGDVSIRLSDWFHREAHGE
jgi:hypothetical protein